LIPAPHRPPTFLINLHDDFVSMCDVVTLLHARISYLIAARSAFFSYIMHVS
jgi:hypothetical protein